MTASFKHDSMFKRSILSYPLHICSTAMGEDVRYFASINSDIR